MTYGFSSDLWVFGYGTGSSGVDLSNIIDDALSGCGYSSDRYEAAQLLGGNQKFGLDGTCVDEWPTSGVSRTIRGGVATTFDGVNQSFNTGYTPTSTGSFTVGVWLKTAASADLSNEAILTCNITSTSGWRLYGFSSTVMRFQVSGGSVANRSFGINYNGLLNDGQWHLLIVTYDTSAGNVKAYVDGALKQTISGTVDTFVQPTRTIKVGSNSTANGDYFTGQLQLPAIWEGTAADADLAFKWYQQEYADVTYPTRVWHLNGSNCHDLTGGTDTIASYNSPAQYSDQDVPVAWLDRFGYETKSSVDVPARYDSGGVSTSHLSDNTASSTLGEARSDAKLVQGTATKFSATNQIMKGSVDVTGQSQFTISFWSDFSSDTAASDVYLLSLYGSSSANRQFLFGYHASTKRLNSYIYGSSTSEYWHVSNNASVVIEQDKWQHITAVFDKDATTFLKVYIDGVYQNVTPQKNGSPTELDNTTNPADFAIGTLAGAISGYHSRASFQLPAVWIGTALNDAEVLSNYKLELDDVPAPTYMWHMDGSSGYNLISNSNHLTATNSPVAGTQDRVHWNALKGFSTANRSRLSSSAQAKLTEGSTITMKVKTAGTPSSKFLLISSDDNGDYAGVIQSGNSGSILVNGNGTILSSFTVDGVDQSSATRDAIYTLLTDDVEHTVEMTFTGSGLPDSWGYVETANYNSNDSNWDLLDSEGYATLTEINGNAVTSADIDFDTLGDRIPALDGGSTAADGRPVQFPSQVGHNGAESKIDFTNGGSFYWLDELYEGAGDFDGSSSWIDLDHNLLDTSEDFTIELEFNPDTTTGNDCIFQFATASTNRVAVNREGSSLRIQRYDGVTHGANWNVSAGTWYTLKITWDATAGDWSEKLLNDSAPLGTSAAVSTSTGAPFMAVGSAASGNSIGSVGLFEGKIRRLKITQSTVKIDMPLISNALDFSGSNNHGTATSVTFPTITASSAWAYNASMTCPQSWNSTDGNSFVILKPKSPTQKT